MSASGQKPAVKVPAFPPTVWPVQFCSAGRLRESLSTPQSTQSAGPVRFLICCSISIYLLASLVAGRRPQCSAGPP
jgi:hypothetical protein